MAANFLVGTVELAKVLMTIFIMLYAYFFLKNAADYEERKPWEFLYIASMFLFMVQVVATLQLFKGGGYLAVFFHDLQQFLEFGFITFFLFSFIYQHYMLVKRGALLIEDKTRHSIKQQKGWWEAVAGKYKSMEEKVESKIEHDEEDAEEELKEELGEMDEELKKEEEEIDNIVRQNEIQPEKDT